jgi:hypothetical protein
MTAMAGPTKKFKAKLGTEDAGSLFIELPFDPKEAFGMTRAKVKVTVNGHTYRSTVAVYGGRFYLPVRKSNRDAAGVSVGEVVSVQVALDTEPRTVDVPRPLAHALAKNRRAKAAWNKLSYSHQREYADHITGAKRPETVAARVRKAVERILEKV